MKDRLDGPYPVLPRPLDALSEGWAGLRPRVRVAVAVLAALAVLGMLQARVAGAERRWGGTPVTALVATTDLAAGTRSPSVRAVELPPAAIPPDAVAAVAPDAVLALALPEGAVLTTAHLDPRGPAAGLGADLRAVPVPVEDGWGVTAGAFVDVWVLGADAQPARQVARARSVLEVTATTDGTGSTALLGLSPTEVGPTTTALADGRVLLTHAPAP